MKLLDAVLSPVQPFLQLPQALERLHRQLEGMAVDLSDCWRAVRGLAEPPSQTHYGQVYVLWQYEGSSRLLSRTAIFQQPGESVEVPINLYYPLPAGAWVVASGCGLEAVKRGNEIEDVDVPSAVGLLSKPLDLGARLTVRVTSPLPARQQPFGRSR